MQSKSIIVLLVLHVNKCFGEVFSSTADMQKLLNSVGHVNQMVQKYIEMEEQRLKRLHEAAQQFATVYAENAKHFTNEAFYNPTSAYLIVKLLASSWLPIEELMKENTGESYLKDVTTGENGKFAFPTLDDVTGLSKALMILQSVYELETRDLADGKFPGDNSPVVMKARDCYDIGRVAYDRKQYHHTILWMQEALERSEREKPGSSINESEILEYLAYPLGEVGEHARALELTERLLAFIPDHPRAPQNIAYYKHVLENKLKDDEQKEADEMRQSKAMKYGTALTDVNSYDNYAALCRGDIKHSPEELSRLYCYYKMDNSFLRLAPIKVELLKLNPIVRLFRQVITDNEIEIITNIASPKLFRSMVIAQTGNGTELSESRISKNTWLHDNDHAVAARLTKRVKDMTDLDMETAEQFQVANYGIGGHYQPHVDMLLVDPSGNPDLENIGFASGDRIATVLFYISQPIAGGATVFPELNLTLFPSKYDAVFWYNYHPNGIANMGMRHSGCPVVIGTKWILNKWIHERGQEFVRPCGINEFDHE